VLPYVTCWAEEKKMLHWEADGIKNPVFQLSYKPMPVKVTVVNSVSALNSIEQWQGTLYYWRQS